ncbi:MAG TPA: hypothetical protein VFP58_04310, partial [Candidatus Eisenbacteria bacterium]|nr:hypothetical protein [Candidatus Eisenbacteria bacterium]
MAVAAVLGASAAPARAQVFHVQAGTSTLYQAHGASLYIRSDRYESWIGLADLDPLRVGAKVRTHLAGADWTLGDESVPFQLPTDILQPGQSILARGLGMQVERDGTRVTAFGGATSVVSASPYSFWAKGVDPVGLVFFEAPSGPKTRVTSRTLYSGAMTTILGLDWKATPKLDTAWAAGAGAEDGYFAWSGRYEASRVSAKAAYVVSGEEFRRVLTPQPGAAEMDRENVEVTVRAAPGLIVGAARNTYRQAGGVESGRRGTVNQFLVNAQVRRTQLGGALFASRAPGAGGTGVSVTLGREVIPHVRMTGSWLYSDPTQGKPSSTVVLHSRETLSPRFELSQVLTHTGGNTTVSFGGGFTSNMISVGAEYQTVYLPFAATDAFRQALMLTVRFQGLGNFQGTLGSYVGPDGQVRYTAQGSQYLYRGAAAPPQTSFGIHDFVIRGTVTDEEGAPVKGAALRIGEEIVFTDSRGSFFVRMKKERPYAVQVLVDEFLVSGRFEVVNAPDQAVAGPEDAPGEITVVVRRIPGSPVPAE